MTLHNQNFRTSLQRWVSSAQERLELSPRGLSVRSGVQPNFVGKFVKGENVTIDGLTSVVDCAMTLADERGVKLPPIVFGDGITIPYDQMPHGDLPSPVWIGFDPAKEAGKAR